MVKVVDNEEYLNTSESIKFFEAPRQRFYDNIRPQLPIHRFDGKKAIWHKRSDMEAFKEGKPVRKADISITGMFSDWAKHLEDLGYNAETKDDEKIITTLPEDAVKFFKLSPDRKFLKREKMSYASGTPICVWSTYYPVDLIEPVLDQIMRGDSIHIIEYIKDVYGLTPQEADERNTARIATFIEQTRFHLRNEQAVLTIQRAAYTKGEKDLILYSDMVLLGDWFDFRRKYPINHWD